MTEEPHITHNHYGIGDVLAAIAFSAVSLFIAAMIGYGLGRSDGVDRGKVQMLEKAQVEP